eukprot:1392462-Rhodomonas_salina.2
MRIMLHITVLSDRVTWNCLFPAQVIIAKWVLVGRAKEEHCSLSSLKVVCFFHLNCLDCQMDAILHTLSCGLFLAELYYALLGFHIELGQSFLNSSFLASQDADLVSIRPGAIIDDDAYVSAHHATLDGGYEARRAFVGAGAVLHPQSGLFCGSIAERATLLPRSKPLSVAHIPADQTWAGTPAARVRTRPPNGSASQAGSPIAASSSLSFRAMPPPCHFETLPFRHGRQTWMKRNSSN